MRKIILSKKRKVVSAVIGVTVIGIGVGGFFILKSKNRIHAQVIPTSQTAQVSQGNISTTVIGTGTLESDAALAIKIPSGITIDEVLVESGDKVREGDVLATVDPASLTSEINTVQKEISTLDEKISECQDSTDTETLTSNVEGRVKKIYASSDTDVLDTIAEHGALLSLSLDGKMAVDLENAFSLSQGESVTVTDSDGNTYTGTVADMSGSSATITVTDYGTTMDDTVTVTSSTGTTLGSGTLYIHNQLDITASSGTVSAVYVSEDQAIDTDTSLLKLTGVSDSAEYEELLATRSNLTEKLQTLVNLSKTNKIVSEYSGTIQSVSVSDGNETGSSTTTNSGSSSSASSVSGTSGQAAAMSYSGTQIKTTNMIYTPGAVKTTCSTSAETVVPVETTNAVQTMAAENTVEEDSSADNSNDAEAYQTATTSITACSPTVDYPEAGKTPQNNTLETAEYSGTITWNTEDREFQEGTAYSAVLQLTAKEGYCFTQNISINYRFADINYLTVSSEEEGNTITFQLTFPSLAKSDNNNAAAGNESQNNSADTAANGTNTTGTSDNTGNSDSNQNSDTQNTPSANSNTATNSASTSSGSVNSDSGSGSSGTGSTNTGSDSTEDTSDTKTNSADTTDINTQLTTAFTVSSNDYMILSVDIDELDILSIALDQKAAITFDALEDEEFEGTVTAISDSATTSSGGVSKYAVNITIPADDNMRIGMNASATIVIEEKSDVLLIPVSALQEKGDQVFVYTEEDSESGQLSGETQIETGISDGSQVEIVSGLTAGQTVYYTRSESTNSSGENTDRMMPNGMSGGPGGDSSGGTPGRNGGSVPGNMGAGRQGGQ